MNIVQITPGAGGMFCGNCFRDNALVAALRKLGHETLLVPLYLPMTLEEADQSAGTPIFYSGINVYLEQKIPAFSRAPAFLRRWLASPALLKWAAGRAAKTRAQDVGDLTVSMLRGEEGRQAAELEELIAWLKKGPRPDVISLSNSMLAGLARKLRLELGAPVVCMFQGEDTFLDGLPRVQREEAWRVLSERAADVDLFVAPSHYFADLMSQKLGLAPDRVRVIYNGINLDGFFPASAIPDPPVIGYFARMCREKGLDTLIEAFIQFKQRNNIPGVKLKIGGGMGPSDAPFVEQLKSRLTTAGLVQDVEFFPNLDRIAKQELYRTFTVFSVPALYGEAFGLYLVEAWASGVPVVQPRHASFPELIQATGAGLLCEAGSPAALAENIERLLLNPDRLAAMRESGRKAVVQDFSIERMTQKLVELFRELTRPAAEPSARHQLNPQAR
jgi:glycosyltransferase involved in cell wall biosynthesis